MIGYNIMVSVEILTRCSYETLTAKFVQVVKIRLFTVVSNSYAKITFLPKRPLLTYVISSAIEILIFMVLVLVTENKIYQ